MNQLADRQDRYRRKRLHGLVRVRALQLASAWIKREVSNLDPGCFALVMATGIISIAFFLQGHRQLSDALFAVSLIAYSWLAMLTAMRAAHFGSALWADLLNPRIVFSFFTIVAATDVLGIAIDMRGFAAAALAMWLFALVIWLILIYFGFGVLLFVNTDDRAKVVDGGWLNAIVGTQSLVILGTHVALQRATGGPAILFLMHMLWAVGLAFYGMFAVLVSYRMFFFELTPHRVTPILWIVMGAAAISANAGSSLIAGNNEPLFLRSIGPFIDGAILMMWAWGTWWIPLLLLLGIWKHGVHRMPISYAPVLWSIVFPLGMYAVATLRLSLAAQVPPLRSLSQAMAWIALAAWVMTSAGLVVASLRSARALAEQHH